MSFIKILTRKFSLLLQAPILITSESDFTSKLDELKEEIKISKDHLVVSEQDIADIKSTVEEARRIYYENSRLNAVIEQVSDLTYAMAWQKDIDGLYEYANKIHCVRFFGLPESCHQWILGRSDIDLINYYVERTGEKHTFGELCISTDQHCIEQGKRCHYIEMGWQGNELLLLSVRKAPRFDEEGNCIGTVGVAMEDTVNCRDILDNLPKRIQQGEVEELDRGVWWIKESPCSLLDIPTGYVPSFV